MSYYRKRMTRVAADKIVQTTHLTPLSRFEEDGDDFIDSGHGGSMHTGLGRKRKVDWKTEWLIYHCYVCCGFRLKEMEVFLLGVSDALASDIVYAWTGQIC
eukprot:scaffold36167_cov51-Attheya_sp.AAC.2